MKVVVGEIFGDMGKVEKLRKIMGYDEFPTKDGLIFGKEVDCRGIISSNPQDVYNKMHAEAEKVLPQIKKHLPNAQAYFLVD